MELRGTIKLIGKVQEIKLKNKSKDFKKQNIVLTTDEQYPQDILIEFIQDNIDLLKNFTVNDKAIVGINIRGREWENPETKEIRYFNSIQGWRIAMIAEETETAEVVTSNSEQADDDLPF
tara:strand:- start:1512 stop:1871 length:360 start_codon:yes stop_codon:yes gene_type:complete